MYRLTVLLLLLMPALCFAQVSEHNEYHKALESAFNQVLKPYDIQCEAVRSGRYNVFEGGDVVYPTAVTVSCEPLSQNPPDDPHDPPTDPDEPPVDPDPPVDPIPGEPSVYRGIPDPNATMGFDVFADYPATHTLTGTVSRRVAECNGTASNPCVYDATGQTMQRLVLSGSYIVVKGGQINYPPGSGPAVNAESCNYCVLQDVVASGPGVDSSHSAAVGLGRNVVWLRGKIHGFGDNRKDAREQDFHGIKTGGDGPTWILDAEIYDNSGDSVQVGDASRGASNNVFIGGGYFHDNRENGVDIKNSNNIVVSGVLMSGFSPTSSDPGSAIVIHNDADNAKFFDNVISDTFYGISITGRSGHIVEGNSINADSKGIECRNTSNVVMRDNDITAPTTIDIQDGCKDAQVTH